MKAIVIVLALCALTTTAQQKNSKIIQLDIIKLLNARPVTVLTDNKLITWNKGIDGNGIGDGYATYSAAVFNGDKAPHALPDDALIAANDSHPEVKLHYSNRDTLNKQACNIAGEDSVEFAVAKGKYKAIYLALTSSEGPSSLKIKLTYTDGSEEKDFTLPDYYLDLPANDPNLCYLVHDLAKWGNKNNMAEKDHHNIDLLNIHPNPSKTLKSISLSKTKPGYLVFWAATGVKAD
jgi:hypothetical protein